jgi:hypothetical protein
VNKAIQGRANPPDEPSFDPIAVAAKGSKNSEMNVTILSSVVFFVAKWIGGFAHG